MTDIPQQNLIGLRHAHSQGQDRPELYRRDVLGDKFIALSEKGVEQAKSVACDLASYLKDSDEVEIYYAEDYRSYQTAHIVSETLSAVFNKRIYLCIEPLLDKQSFGALDGYITPNERQQKAAQAHADFERQVADSNIGPLLAKPKDGESLSDLFNRQQQFLEQRKQAKVRSRPVVIITHGTNILALQAVQFGYDLAWVHAKQDTVPNCVPIRLEA